MHTAISSRIRILGSVFVAGIAIGIAGTSIAAGQLGSSVFSDVQSGTYYDEAIGELYAAGILQGSNGRFRPADPINRADFAVAIQRLRRDLLGLPISGDAGSVASVSSRSRSSLSSSSRSSSSTSSSSSSSSSSSKQKVGPQGELTFTVDDLLLPESAKGVTIAVVRQDGDSDDVSVDFEVTSGTAILGEDFYKNNATLKFAAGETTKTIQVLFINDKTVECNEQFHYRIKNPTNGAVLGDITEGTVTIIDNEQGGGGYCEGDTSSSSSGGSSSSSSSSTSSTAGAGAFNFSAVGYAVAENGGTLTVTVNRADGSLGTATVNYATSDSSARTNTDYTPASGTLTFNAGETSKTFTVSVSDDSAIDGNKLFTLTLSTPTGGSVLGTLTTATATIVDDEASEYGNGALKFSKTTYDVSEGGDAVLIVQRVGGASGTATIAYNTTSGTASGNDFTPVSGTLTFLNGEATKELHVSITKDDISDIGETFYMNLSVPTGATLSSPSSATVTIYQ